jgi:hypothetical protein
LVYSAPLTPLKKWKLGFVVHYAGTKERSEKERLANVFDDPGRQSFSDCTGRQACSYDSHDP